MLPSFVDSHITNVFEPLKVGAGDTKQRQIVGDKMVSRLSEEVNTAHAIGQATQDQVAALTTRIEQLEEMAVAQARSSAQSSGSMSIASAQPAADEHHRI